MRRTTPYVEPIAGLQTPLGRAVSKLGEEDVRARIALLEPLASEARRERIREIVSRRIGTLTVLLDSLHDPYNGAAIVRSCEVFGIASAHVIERSESFLAARSVTRGAEQWVDIIPHADGEGAALHLKSLGFELVAAHPEGELTPEDLAGGTSKIALVLGNEHAGIADDLAAHCARRVRIPMRGFTESLNVSVTTAILLYTATRGRAGDLSALDSDRRYLRGLLQSISRSPEILEAHQLAVALAPELQPVRPHRSPPAQLESALQRPSKDQLPKRKRPLRGGPLR